MFMECGEAATRGGLEVRLTCQSLAIVLTLKLNYFSNAGMRR
jgi:hypothetical protein